MGARSPTPMLGEESCRHAADHTSCWKTLCDNRSRAIGLETEASFGTMTRHTKTTTVKIEPTFINTSNIFGLTHHKVFSANHEVAILMPALAC